MPLEIYKQRSTGSKVFVLKRTDTMIRVKHLHSSMTSWYFIDDFLKRFKPVPNK